MVAHPSSRGPTAPNRSSAERQIGKRTAGGRPKFSLIWRSKRSWADPSLWSVVNAASLRNVGPSVLPTRGIAEGNPEGSSGLRSSPPNLGQSRRLCPMTGAALAALKGDRPRKDPLRGLSEGGSRRTLAKFFGRERWNRALVNPPKGRCPDQATGPSLRGQEGCAAAVIGQRAGGSEGTEASEPAR